MHINSVSLFIGISWAHISSYFIIILMIHVLMLGVPYGGCMGYFNTVEHNMRMRRQAVEKLLTGSFIVRYMYTTGWLLNTLRYSLEKNVLGNNKKILMESFSLYYSHILKKLVLSRLCREKKLWSSKNPDNSLFKKVTSWKKCYKKYFFFPFRCNSCQSVINFMFFKKVYVFQTNWLSDIKRIYLYNSYPSLGYLSICLCMSRWWDIAIFVSISSPGISIYLSIYLSLYV